MTINKPISLYSIILVLLIAFTTKAEDPKGLNVGELAPLFMGFNQFDEQVNLQDLLKSGPDVLLFYRGHWCKYCNRQLEALSDSLEFIKYKGASIVAVTPETMEIVDETSKEYDNSFQIISDSNIKIVKDYKVNFEVKKTTTTKYKFAGINLNQYNGENGTNLPVPAAYIIGQDGKIDYVFFDMNYKKRVSVSTLLMNL